ncbi:ribonuclease P protein component [Stackebrandtia soli]|uniref:ribonuclease P protein component n=1 Tax=Stackebrandtia soli TaxID=1892856 RepID=UPI0039EC2E01
MLPTTARLRRSSDFAAALKYGSKIRRGAVVVHVMTPNTDGGESRAGFIVSKAVGGAVTRNLVKRRLRHIVADRMATFTPGTDIVVRALPFASEVDYHRLERDVEGALRALAERGRRP